MQPPTQQQQTVIKSTPFLNDPAAETKRIGKIFQDRHQFEEAVQKLLKEHEANKPTGIFY